MRVSDAYAYIADLVGQVETILESREREERGGWAITAFRRFRVVELLGLSPSTSYGGDFGCRSCRTTRGGGASR